MVWIMKLLVDHPDVATRLREELREHLVEATQENRLPTVDEILNTKLAYLEAVLEEVLRLRAAMLVPRDATRDTQLLGHRIPKGTSILLVCQGPDFSPSPSSAYWQETKADAARQFPGTRSKGPELRSRPLAGPEGVGRARVRRHYLPPAGVRTGHPVLLGPSAGLSRDEDHDGHGDAEL